MCGRFTKTVEKVQIKKEFQVANDDIADDSMRYNIAPSHLQILNSDDKLNTVRQMPILVINSEYFEDFLAKLKGNEGRQYFKSNFNF